MNLRDRVLYHQIHPLKLVTDWATAGVATALFWKHQAASGFVVGFVPSIVVTAALVRWADLEPYRRSALGRYVGRYMSRTVELARFAGLIPLWGGAWVHSPALIVAGVAWIVACWLGGLVVRRPSGAA